jgi:hypothetical protein
MKTGTVRKWKALALGLMLSSFYQEPYLRADAPTLVETTSPGTLDGFELFGNGLDWWSTGFPGDEVTKARPGLVGLRSALQGVFLSRRGNSVYLTVNTTAAVTPPNGVARTDSNVYLYRSGGGGFHIVRRALFGLAPDNLGDDFSPATYDQVGAMLRYGNSLIWSVVQGGQGQIRIKGLDAPAGDNDAVLFGNVGLAKKLVVAQVPGDNTPDFYYLFVLTFDGLIYSYVLSPSIQDPGPFLFASNGTDMAARAEVNLIRGGGIGGILRQQSTTALYVTTGVNLGSDRLSGRLVRFDLFAGGSATHYDSGDVNLQLTGVAVDADHLFITRTPIKPGSGLFGPGLDLANSQVLRKGDPANGSLFGITDFTTIAIQQEGRNLRSDDQWVYWASGNQLFKIHTDAPELQLDYKAVGLEAVQTIQDFNNSLPLVALKGTIVRAYAQIVTNTTGFSNFQPNAQLRGFLDGTEFPDSPIYPYSLAQVDNAGDLPTLRGTLKRSFNFQLPDGWVAKPGSLRLDFTVNPTGSVPETGVSPIANNGASATLTIVQGRRPSVVFKAMSSTFPNYDMFAPNSGFNTIIDRANSLMPLDHLKTYFSEGSVTKPVFTLLGGFKNRSFSLPGDAQDALNELKDAEEDSDDPPGATDVHWAGMFPFADNPWNGLGNRPGKCLILRMDATSSWTGAWGTVMGGYTLAHELSHNYGRKHIDQVLSASGCPGNQSAGPWDTEPGGQDPCTLAVNNNLTSPSAPIGYDWLTDNLVLPSSAADIMTYAFSYWMSPYNWNALISAIPVGGIGVANQSQHGGGVALDNPPATPDIVRVSGSIRPDLGTAWLLPVWQFPAGTISPAKVKRSLDEAAALPPNAPYRLRLLGDPQAPPLIEQPVAVQESSDGATPILQFAQAVPLVPGVKSIQLVSGNTVLSEVRASANSPVLQLQAPNFDAGAQSLALNWSASDADGDVLYFTSQFSHDNGATWQTLQTHDPTLGVVVSTALLPGGDQCRLRVLATDGFNTTISITDAFALPKHGPVVSINGVRDQQQFPFGSAVLASAFAYDPEEGSLDGSSIQWNLTGLDKRTATGNNLALRSLAPGAYALTATVADSDGNSGTGNVGFQVRPIEIPDGPAPVLDGLAADAGYADAPSVLMPPNIGTRSPSVVHFLHSGGYLYVCFSGLDYTTNPDLPASVGVYFDTKNSGDATAQSSDVGFGISEGGVLSQVSGNGTIMVSQPVSPGFTAALVLGDNSWSAELRIADSLLGGWNHPVGLMLAHYFPNLFAQLKIWPAAADVNHPNTWTTASLGPLPAIPNRPPTAMASGPALISLTEPQTVTLDGTASYDLDNDPLTFGWTQVDGPPVTLNGSTTAQPTFDTTGISADSTLHFQLVVNDGQASSAPATVGVHLVLVQSAPAPVQSPLALNTSNGTVSGQLPWNGSSGDMALVQASSNLVDWVNIATNEVGFRQEILFTDLQAGLYPQRFYRTASWQPVQQSGAGTDLAFNGTNSLVTVAPDPALDAFPLSIMFWLKTSDTGFQARGLVSKYADGQFNGYSLFLSAGHVRGWYFKDGNNYVWDGSLGLDSGFVANGQWNHIALVADTAGARLYVNGSLASTLSWTGTPGATTSALALQFGRYSTYPDALAGEMDEISLWNHALSEADIATFMGHPLSGAEDGLLGYWPLNDGQGDKATDLTGHGYDGSLQNGPVWQPSTAPVFY